MEISTQRTALLVIDMQNGFLDPAGSMAALELPVENLRPAVAGCRELVDLAQQAGVPVIYTRYVFQPGHLDAGYMATEIIPALSGNRTLEQGFWDADIIDELKPGADAVIIDKSRPSSFYGTRLEPVLQSLDIRHLVLAGVTTNICVETTARDAGQRDYGVHVVADACAEFDPARHDHALSSIGFFFGRVTDLAQVRSAWSGS